MYIYIYISTLYSVCVSYDTQYNKNEKKKNHILTPMIRHFSFEFCVNMGFYCGSPFFEMTLPF